MLVLSRKIGEQIVIGHDIRITVVRLTPTTVRIGIDAPAETQIMRRELIDATSADQPPRTGKP